MKKFTKMHVLALALLASQQVMPSERQEDFLDLPVEQVIKAEPKKSYWTWDNGKWVLAGAAALGAGALAYMYQDDIKAWVSSLTEQEAIEQKAALLEDVMQDLQDIEQKQESIKSEDDKSAQDIAAMQEEIAQKQEQVAKKQTMLEYLQAMFTAAPLSDEDRLTAEQEAAWKKQNQDDREETNPTSTLQMGLINVLLRASNPMISSAQKRNEAEQIMKDRVIFKEFQAKNEQDQSKKLMYQNDADDARDALAIIQEYNKMLAQHTSSDPETASSNVPQEETPSHKRGWLQQSLIDGASYFNI